MATPPLTLSLLALAILAGLGVLVYLLTRARPTSSARTVDHTLWCPIARDIVTARCREEHVGEPVEVLSCSRFEPSQGLTCSRLCLDQLRAQARSNTTRGV